MVRYVKPISYFIFYAIFVPVLMDCPEHTFSTNAGTVIGWPESPSSDLWIASDCLDSDKRLVFRRCVGDTWIPSNDEIVDNVNPLCYFVMNNEVRLCPSSYTAVHIEGPPSRTLCALLHDSDTTGDDDTICTIETVSFMELNSDEKYQIIETMSSEKKGVFRLGARNMWPNKSLSRFQNEDIELQNTVCGRFGLLLKLTNKSVSVNCPDEGECDNMCLSLNILDKKSVNESIEKCGRGLFTIFDMTFLDQFGCPFGYYRPKFYPTTRSSCFSIKLFDRPVHVTEITSDDDFESYCEHNGTIMIFDRRDDMFIFRQISEYIGLSNGNNCLFGQYDSNYLVNYTLWTNYSSQIEDYLLRWDKTMNYGRLEEEISYLASKPNGEWTWALDTVSCIACVVEISETPELLLQYTFLQRKLELDVIHQEFLYKQKKSDLGFICFALIGNIYKDNVTICPINDSKYLIENVGMGKYWCSGHNIATGKFYSSDKIDAYGIVFVFQVVRKCDKNCVFSTNDLNDFLKIFRQSSQVVTVVEAPNIQLIKNESTTQYTFIAHLSLTLQDIELIEDLDLTLMNLTSYQKETVLIYENLKKILYYNESNEMNIESIRSTEYCLHESVFSVDTVVWRVAYINEVIFLSSLCPSEENDLERTRICSGNYMHGTFWESSINVTNCYTAVSKSLLEVYLNFTRSSQTEEVIENVKNIIQENIDALLPVDVFITSKIHQKITNVTFSDLEKILSIYNNLLQIEENILKISASMNSTNILLEALNIILSSHIESSIIGSSEYLNEGNISILLPFIEIFILDPLVSNLSGIALYRPLNASMSDKSFTNYLHRYVYQYESIDYLPDHDLVIGSYVPADKIKFLQNVTIALVVFFNDTLFQSNKEKSDDAYFKANGKVMSLMIVGTTENAKLTSIKIPIFFQSEKDDNVTCGLWNVTSIDGWSSYGCSLRNVIIDKLHKLAICECSYSNHLRCSISRSHNFVNIVNQTLIIIIASLLAIIGILLIAFLIWRKKLLTFLI